MQEELSKIKEAIELERQQTIEQAEDVYRKKMESFRVIQEMAVKLSNKISNKDNQLKDTPSKRSRGLLKKIEDLLPEFKEEFKVDNLMELLTKDSPVTKRSSVTDALRDLAKKGKVEIIIAGKGRQEGIYKVKNKGTLEIN